jgi:hypothetical protein
MLCLFWSGCACVLDCVVYSVCCVCVGAFVCVSVCVLVCVVYSVCCVVLVFVFVFVL